MRTDTGRSHSLRERIVSRAFVEVVVDEVLRTEPTGKEPAGSLALIRVTNRSRHAAEIRSLAICVVDGREPASVPGVVPGSDQGLRLDPGQTSVIAVSLPWMPAPSSRNPVTFRAVLQTGRRKPFWSGLYSLDACGAMERARTSASTEERIHAALLSAF